MPTFRNTQILSSLNRLAKKPFAPCWVAPIIHQRKVLGVLAAQAEKARAFSGEEEAFLVTLAAQLATVIAHAEARGLVSGHYSPWLRNLRALAAAPGVAIGQAFYWFDRQRH